MIPITRSELSDRPGDFRHYIDLVAEGDLHQRLRESQRLEDHLDLGRFAALATTSYAPGKWTVNDVLQHIVDTERVFAYRALRFARGDRTHLPGFDQDLFARHAGADARPFADLVAELRLVRAATISMYAAFSREALCATGVCSTDITISVASLGFAIVGHQQHHVGVLRERYARVG
jgi:hypothetical protein